MEMFAPNQIEKVAIQNGFSSPYDESISDWHLLLRYNFVHEDHNFSAYPLARFLAKQATMNGKCLGVFDKTTVWCSGRDNHLINLVLSDCFGASGKAISDGTAFVAKSDEFSGLCTLIHIAIIFGWDLFLFPSSIDQQIFVSHDSYFEIHGSKFDATVEKRFVEETKRNQRGVR